jgi:hypothetical protein
VPVIPVTWETEEGITLEPQSSRPAWQQNEIPSQKQQQYNRSIKEKIHETCLR